MTALLSEATLAHLGIAPVLEYVVRARQASGELVAFLPERHFLHRVGIRHRDIGKPIEPVPAVSDCMVAAIKSACACGAFG